MPTKRGVIRFFTFFKRLPAESRLDFLPALKVLRDYDTGKLKRDFLAGINVALLAFPQGMAYAMIAGLPIEYGLYGSAIALIVGMLLLVLSFRSARTYQCDLSFAAQHFLYCRYGNIG